MRAALSDTSNRGDEVSWHGARGGWGGGRRGRREDERAYRRDDGPHLAHRRSVRLLATNTRGRLGKPRYTLADRVGDYVRMPRTASPLYGQRTRCARRADRGAGFPRLATGWAILRR